MPLKDPDPTDPMTLHGVAVDTDNDQAVVEMAQCFIEEYARLGFTADRILGLFKVKGYAGPHITLVRLGEAAIVQMIEREMAVRGSASNRKASDVRACAGIPLPVLNAPSPSGGAS